MEGTPQVHETLNVPHLHPPLPSVQILGVNIHSICVDDVLRFVERCIRTDQRAVISYANVQALNLAYRLPWFRHFLNQSSIVFCDGFGVKWGARLLGQRIPHRFTPPDWFERLATIGQEHNIRFFFLGAKPGIAEQAADTLKQGLSGLQVVGTYHGHFDKSRGSYDNEIVIQKINQARPHILVVGFGMPIQEQWLLENWHRIDANIAFLVGAMFDYMAGNVARGPRWMTDYGLEWLARLVIEPKRLWRRYILGIPLFLWRVFRQRIGLLDLPRQT